jgi:hypothetical protein
MSEVVESMQIGENVEITFYRSGEKKTESLEILLNKGILEYAKQFDIRPRYVCFAGLTFVSVSRNLLESWGSNWPSEIPFYLRYLFNNYQDLNKEPKRKEYVLISTILPDEINSYADDFTWQPLERIDDVEIYSLDDVYKAVNSREDGFYEIKFMGSNRILPVNVNKAKENQTKILTTYNIPQETYLEGQQ